MARALQNDGGVCFVDIEPSDTDDNTDVGKDQIRRFRKLVRNPQKRSRSPQKRSRSPQKRSRSPRRTLLGFQDNLVRRGAINSASSSLSAPGPQSLVNGNWMLANWYIGKQCNPREFAKRLSDAPFDCVVLVFPEHDLKHEIFEYIKDLAAGQSANTADVLGEKAVFKVCQSIYVALHRAKIDNATYTPFSIRSRDAASQPFSFGSLELFVRDGQQKMQSINIGLVDVRTRQGYSGATYERDAEQLVDWIVKDGVDVLTGFFGHSKNFVESIAVDAGATHTHPLYQGVACSPLEVVRSRDNQFPPEWWTGSWWEEEYYLLPTYFILYKSYKKITLPNLHTVIPDAMVMGQDIWSEMCAWGTCPTWPWLPHSEGGHLGNIKMKRVDYDRWFDHCFQTVMWLGTATPSHKSRQRQLSRLESQATAKTWPKGSVGRLLARTGRSGEVQG
jgi:hypothetical protein